MRRMALADKGFLESFFCFPRAARNRGVSLGSALIRTHIYLVCFARDTRTDLEGRSPKADLEGDHHQTQVLFNASTNSII